MRAAVAKEFQGERIFWAGRPSAIKTFAAALPIWLFAVPWTAFSLGWEYLAFAGWLSGKMPPSGTHQVFGVILPVFGVPFVVIGLGMLAAPLIAWRRARRTAYVIGDRRLVAVRVGRRLNVNSWQLAGLVRTERIEQRDGTGTLKVVTAIGRDSDGDKKEDVETLYGIPDVRKVEQLLMAQMDGGRRAA